jgi:RimJ/RimL family protein N-acetyltransferase
MSRRIAFSRNGGSLFGVHVGPEYADAIEALVLEHAPNEWNHLVEEELHQRLAGIATDKTFAVVAESPLDGHQLLGAVLYETGHRYPQYQPNGRQTSEHGYISEAVVHRKYTGKGIGSDLLQAAIRDLTAKGLHEIYARRHADNIPSARMMEKSGLVVVDRFYDPEIRLTGSRQTVVARFTAKD